MLVALRLRGALPLSRLAERLGLDRTSLYRAVRPLERRGTLAIRGGHTPRELVAELTPEGRRLIEEALPVWEETQQRFVAALGPRSWEALRAAVAHVEPAIHAAASTPPSRPDRSRSRR
jgi:DNA-binding MarR family transcriptional regulator